MRVVRKTAIVMVLLLVVEVLYLDDNPFSLGFPFRSVQYKSELLPGQTSPSAETGWLAAFRVDPILLVCDVSVAVLLVLLLVGCVPPAVLVPVTQGCVLGCVAGAVTFGLDGLLSEPWLSVAGALILLTIVPFGVYTLSLGRKHQKTVIVIIACATLPTCIRAGFVVDGLRDGVIDELPINLGAVLRFAALSGVLACLCFVLMVLHKRVLRAIWRKKRVIPPAATVHSDIPQTAHPSEEQAGRRSKIRRAVLYTSLLVITLYVGWHFKTIRAMREDDFVVSDAIDSEFERLKVPFGVYSFTSPKGDSELLKAGWNVSYQVEIRVNGKDTYVADIKKSILVPWIQVKIHKKENAAQTDSRNTSDE